MQQKAQNDCLCDILPEDRCPVHGKGEIVTPTYDLKVERLIREKGGILLNLGSGTNIMPRFVNLDIRDLPGVDIVHDMEIFPWPFPDECCITVTASHVYEHIKPWLSIDWMNEIWRITKVGGQLVISMPYGYNHRFIQDPTHCNPANEITWQYFDPRFPLYGIYQPKPWKIEDNTPMYALDGDIEVILEKIEVVDGKPDSKGQSD